MEVKPEKKGIRIIALRSEAVDWGLGPDLAGGRMADGSVGLVARLVRGFWKRAPLGVWFVLG